MSSRKMLVLGLALCFMIGAGIIGAGYVRQVVWDNDYLHVIQTVPRGEQRKEFERLLQSASPDSKPHVRYSLVGLYLERNDYPKALDQAEKAVQEFRQLGDTGGQINMLNASALLAIAHKNNAGAEKYLQQALYLLGDSERKPARSMPLFGLRIPGELPSVPKSRLLCMNAGIKTETGHPVEAEVFYKQALLTKDNFEHAYACRNYAEFLKGQHRDSESSSMLKAAEKSIHVKSSDDRL